MAKIRNATEIGGYDYLHYWFQNSRLEIQDFELAKRLSLQEQLKTYKQHIVPGMFSNTSDEESKVFLDLIDEKTETLSFNKYLQELVSNVDYMPPTAGSLSGMDNLSYQSIALKKKFEAQELVNQLGSIIEQTQKHIDDLIKNLSPLYKDQILELLNNARTKRNSMNDLELVNFFLKKNASCVVDSREGDQINAVAKTIDRLEGLIQSLRIIQSPSFKGIKKLTATKSHQTGQIHMKTKSQLIQTIVGKLGGNFSSAAGWFEEVSSLQGALSALEDGATALDISVHGSLAKQLIQEDLKFNGNNITCSTTFQEDVNFKKLKEHRETSSEVYSPSKGDVVIKLSKGKATMEFAIQSKTSRAKSPRTKGIIKLHDETNLANLFQYSVNKGLISWQYIYHMASSRDIEKVPLSEPTKISSDSQMMIQGWRNLLDYASINFFLNALTGANRTEASTLLLIVNRQVFSMADILEKVVFNPKAIISSGSRYRKEFLNATPWLGNQRSKAGAQIRSNKAKQSLQSVFTSNKIVIKLNLLQLGYSI